MTQYATLVENSVISQFMTAVFSAESAAPVTLVAGGVEAEIGTREDLAAFIANAGAEPVYMRPVAGGRIAFLHTLPSGITSPEDWRDFHRAPTAVLHKAKRLILIYTLDKPADLDGEAEGLLRRMGSYSDDLLPLPDQNGWTLTHLDESAFYSLDDLAADYEDTATAPKPGRNGDFGTLNDATILTPFTLDDPAYQQEMVISIGAGRDSVKWQRKTMPVARFVDMLSMHREAPKKDGLAFVLAEIVGANRRKVAVKACYGVGLDIDVGVPGAVIDEALANLGCLAIRYTTHSHFKTKTEFKKDRLVKYADEVGGEFDDPEVIARFLREKEHWDESIIATIDFAGVEHQPEGLMAQINHAPMPKHRVVVPLSDPFVVTEVAKTQDEGMRLWNQVPKALARLLGDLPLDKAALDPSRLFYFPRHAKGRRHETTIFGGPLLDWRTLDLGDAADGFDAALAQEARAGGKGRSTTPDGQALGRWSAKRAGGFQIVDVIRDYDPDRIRANGSTKIDIECPFDEEHSNPGDPKDRGCFAVNAGDGPSPVFTIKCQHDSCAERTNLDMLGKMIADGWFAEEALDDPNYNAIEDDEATSDGRSFGDLQIAPRVGETMVSVEGQRALKRMTTDKRTFNGPEDSNKFLSERLVAVNEAGQHRLAVYTADGVKLMKPHDIKGQYQSFRAIWTEQKIDGRTGKPTKVPKEHNVSAVDLFLASPEIRIFDGVVCDPTGRAAPALLNTWQGIAKKPRKGASTELLHAHLLNSTAGGNIEHYDLCLDFFADMFQNPARKPSWSIAVIGPKGAGKSTLAKALREIIGRHHSTKISQQRHLTGNFNAHQADMLFIVGEEITWGGGRQDTGILNDVISSETMMKEAKGANAYEIASFTRFMFVSEPGWVIPAGAGERRYLVLHAVDLHTPKPEEHPDRAAYFGALWDEFHNGGAEAFLAELLERNLTHFNPYGTPATAALLDQVERTLPDADRWLRNILAEGVMTDRNNDPLPCEALDELGKPLPASHDDFDQWPLEGGFRIETRHVKASYDAHVRRHSGSLGGDQAVMLALKAYGTVAKKRLKAENGRGKVAYYVFEGRQAWRDAFTAKWKLTLE